MAALFLVGLVLGSMSAHRPQIEVDGSEIYILNQSGGDWVYLSPETLHVLERSLYFARISGGHFDPTVKPLVDLWMEKVKAGGRLPTTGELGEALALVGWQNLMVDEDKGKELLNSLEVAGLIVDSAGQIIMSEAWELKAASSR